MFIPKLGESKLNFGFKCPKCTHNNNSCDKGMPWYWQKQSLDCAEYKRRGKSQRPDPNTTKEKLKVKYAQTEEVTYYFYD